MTTRSTELLRAVHRHPGITRADAARLIGIGTGAATELVTKLSRAGLLTQAPATPSGTRGRPTTILLPHPEGPLVLALAITNEAWRLDVVELGGATVTSRSERHEHGPWAEVRVAVAAAVKQLHSRYGPRLRAIGISVPGPVPHSRRPTPHRHLPDNRDPIPPDHLTDNRGATPPHYLTDNRGPGSPAAHLPAGALPPAALPLGPEPAAGSLREPAVGSRGPAVGSAREPAMDSLREPAVDSLREPAVGSLRGPAVSSLRLDTVTSDWHDIDLTELWPEADLLVAGNDATLAATAEHLRGATAAVALHLHIEPGLGGALIENGRPIIGARNTAGEFGHMPFGNPKIKCACGANGCWGTSIDGTALARLLNDTPPRDPVTYARRVIATATRSQRARQDLAGLPPPTTNQSEPPTTPPNETQPATPATAASATQPATTSATPATAPSEMPAITSAGTQATALGGRSATAPSGTPATALGRASVSTSSYSSGQAGPDIDPEAAFEAVKTVGIALGRGIAGLVNALDPDLVTLGGIGPDLLAAVPDAITTAYRNGLMATHRDSPPPILPATLPDDEGPITGAAEEAWTALFPRLA
ncbi:ROK family transcriptional regulator [Actinoplanes couchii]|uniref:ROK family protein n=1 Tax=Actinoplanes couchii TaxID=403638 RepID=A0ABQ3XAK2_9ACTN|nr:ROK family transcriptional regulator [Actinoplanes couchii]MDR6324853.1 putative NBD/HSP70 family sugar kinase [Actinoplanes couchii]GID55525.1 hypothetical protein Aco03nite_039290 [Actinoplanes couchii]